MIITTEAQLRLAGEYGEEKSTPELLAFFEGMQSIISFMQKKAKDEADFYANRLV